MSVRKLIFLLMAAPLALMAQTRQDCENSIARMLASGEFEGRKIQEFLNLQAGITLHKLAYAAVRHSRSSRQFRLEREILSMLEEVKNNRENDPEFNEVYEMFNHPDNKLSRTALSRVLPFVKDIINEQSGEESAFKRKYFNIGVADVRMLAILSEKEAQNSNGIFRHAQFMDHAYDESVLNFTKIINSSINSGEVSKEHMLRSMDKKLEDLYRRAKNLLEDIGLPEECSVLLTSCSQESQGSVVIDDVFLDMVTASLQSADNVDLHDRLRYNDVWLRNNSRLEGTHEGNAANTSRNPVLETREGEEEEEDALEEIEYQNPALSDQQVVENYLVQHVLDHVPFLFTRKELADDMDFTLALSQAIDEGIILKKGRDRVFTVGNIEYFLPELWNDDYPSSMLAVDGGRAGRRARRGLSRFRRWAQGVLPGGEEGNIEVDVPSEIPADLHDDFLTTLNDQVQDHGHEFAFEFRNKLYGVDGQALTQGLAAFKNNPDFRKAVLPNPAELENSPLEPENVQLAANEIRSGNRSYVKDNTVFHISGAPARLDQEYGRARIVATSTDAEVGESSDASFPSQEVVRNLASRHPVLTLKALTDRQRAFTSGDSLVDLHRGAALSATQTADVVLRHRRNHGINIQKAQLRESNEALRENALAILNNEDIFVVNGETRSTYNGQRRGQSGSTEGWALHDERHERLQALNSQSDKAIVLGFYQDHQPSRCEFVTIVDKKNSALEVYRIQEGQASRVFSSAVSLGSQRGDERTLFRNSELSATNNKTGAGTYFFQAPTGDGQPLGLTRDNLDGERENVPMRLERSGLSEARIASNPRSSNGFINLPGNKMSVFQQSFTRAGCPMHVLPETSDVGFQVEEGALRLLPKNLSEFSLQREANKKYMGDFHFSPPAEVEYEEIRMHIKDERFSTESTRAFVGALQGEKRFIMEDLGLTNDEYNELAKLAFGIMGTESSFGEGDRRFGFNWYRFKENPLGQQMVSLLKEGGIPALVAGMTPSLEGMGLRASAAARHLNENSRGDTQIKNVRQYLNQRGPAGENSSRYSEITNESLDNPRHAAIATMYVLAQKLQSFDNIRHNHSGITEENKMDYLYYMYLGSSGQIANGTATPNLNAKVREANAYADQITILTREN